MRRMSTSHERRTAGQAHTRDSGTAEESYGGPSRHAEANGRWWWRRSRAGGVGYRGRTSQPPRPRSLCRRALDHGDCGGEKDVLSDAVACLGTGRGFRAAGEAGATPRPGVLTRRLADPAVAAQRAAQIVRAGAQVLAH